MERIYLDNAATTPVAPEVIEIISEVNAKYFGNPSSIHTIGQEARRIIDESRRFVAFFVGCEPDEIIFTSGGSESDNLAIRGVIESEKLKVKSGKKPHIITSAVEHHAVLHAVQDLEKEGKIEATYLKPDKDGIVSAQSVKDAIRENTVLVSIIYVNNETGVVNPIAKIGDFLSTFNFQLSTRNKSEKRIYFHTDAVQAAEFFQIAPEYLKVDMLTFTAHKLHGPKGIGVLYIKKGTKIKAEIAGGSQEFRLRAGTENISGIAGLHKALDLILKDRSNSKDLAKFKNQPELMSSPVSEKLMLLRDKLVNGLKKEITDVILNGSDVHRGPNIVNLSFLNAEGEAIILNLDFLGVAVSSGSACTSRSLEPSHVLSAMGIPPEKAHGSIRFSFGRYTQEKEIDLVLESMPKIIKKLRDMSPMK